MHTRCVSDGRGEIQEENANTAVASEIRVAVVVAAVLSELNDIITFEREQLASLEGFSCVERTRYGVKDLQTGCDEEKKNPTRPVVHSFNWN